MIKKWWLALCFIWTHLLWHTSVSRYYQGKVEGRHRCDERNQYVRMNRQVGS